MHQMRRVLPKPPSSKSTTHLLVRLAVLVPARDDRISKRPQWHWPPPLAPPSTLPSTESISLVLLLARGAIAVRGGGDAALLAHVTRRPRTCASGRGRAAVRPPSETIP
ncbi:hypothetical protein PYCCODRAFT_372363 [Trametes coccinea BRFM310]|uniref:Uncharacterized protein n=1 Tax=Trametes coccinea (strain BRFM310) TaxID=1353009 RepID=A0A1Y2J3I1_TRAC3|nr:hypothetical protein PYCCODRAFT_372363 [Trametes coccinea BRFM310]